MTRASWTLTAILMLAIAGLVAQQEKIHDLEGCNDRQKEALREEFVYGHVTHMDAAEDETRWPTVYYDQGSEVWRDKDGNPVCSDADGDIRACDDRKLAKRMQP